MTRKAMRERDIRRAKEAGQAVTLRSFRADRIKECRAGWSPDEGHVVKSQAVIKKTHPSGCGTQHGNHFLSKPAALRCSVIIPFLRLFNVESPMIGLSACKVFFLSLKM